MRGRKGAALSSLVTGRGRQKQKRRMAAAAAVADAADDDGEDDAVLVGEDGACCLHAPCLARTAASSDARIR